MFPLRIEGAQLIMSGGSDQAIKPLHVFVLDGDCFVSRWEPTPDELETLNAGGSVELQVIGYQPPVALKVVPHVSEFDAESTRAIR